MPKYDVRYATKEDVHAFYGKTMPTMRAVVADCDGEILALAGIAGFSNQWTMFSQMKEQLPGKTCFRMARLIIGIANNLPGPVYAVAESDRSCKFLERIGFKPMNGVYVL